MVFYSKSNTEIKKKNKSVGVYVGSCKSMSILLLSYSDRF